ncbi:MAG: hypothetical protein ACI83B_004078 [Sediminicola sp.]|jgi:hypothetical protein
MIYFPHIPKAGGTTLKQILYHAFGENNCLKVWNGFASDVDVDDFHQFTHLEQYSAILGHLPVKVFLENVTANNLLKNKKIKIITAVRDPLERLVSQYNYIRVNAEHPDHTKFLTVPLLGYMFAQPANQQVSFLSFEDEIRKDDIELFPIESSVENFAAFLENESGKYINRIDPRNRTSDIAGERTLSSLDDLPNDLILELQEKHLKDIALYHLAQKNVFKNRGL